MKTSTYFAAAAAVYERALRDGLGVRLNLAG